MKITILIEGSTVSVTVDDGKPVAAKMATKDGSRQLELIAKNPQPAEAPKTPAKEIFITNDLPSLLEHADAIAPGKACQVCGDPIPGGRYSANRKLCGKEECRLEQQRRSSRKSYHKLLEHSKPAERKCENCGDDITNLRGNRTICTKPECLTWRKRRSANKWARAHHGKATTTATARPGTPKPPKTTHKPTKGLAAPRATVERPPAEELAQARIDYAPKPKKPAVVKHPGYLDINRKPDDAEWWCLHCKRWGNHTTPGCPNVDHEHASAQQRESAAPFEDPWNCQLCRTEQHLCPMHASMAAGGQTPPVRAGRAPDAPF